MLATLLLSSDNKHTRLLHVQAGFTWSHFPIGGYSETNTMTGGYSQSPGGFASPAASQGGEKKGVRTITYVTLNYVNM